MRKIAGSEAAWMFTSSKGKEKKFEIFEKMEKAGFGISLITRCLSYLTWLLYKQLVIQLENSGEGKACDGSTEAARRAGIIPAM